VTSDELALVRVKFQGNSVMDRLTVDKSAMVETIACYGKYAEAHCKATCPPSGYPLQFQGNSLVTHHLHFLPPILTQIALVLYVSHHKLAGTKAAVPTSDIK
jgi:hypothetical protein